VTNKPLADRLEDLKAKGCRAKTYAEHEAVARDIARLVLQTNYLPHEKLDCHAALDFFEAVEKSFSSLAGDLRQTEEKISGSGRQDSRLPVLRALRAKMERLAAEVKEVYFTINHINRV
jgi:hypothetical protein